MILFYHKFTSRRDTRYNHCMPRRLWLFTLQMFNDPIILAHSSWTVQ